MIIKVDLGMTHGIYGETLCSTQDFDLMKEDRIILEWEGTRFIGLFVDYDFSTEINESELEFKMVRRLDEHERKLYRQQVESHLLERPLKLSNKALSVYKSCSKGNNKIWKWKAELKLTRNVLLAREHDTYYNDRGEFQYMYGSMRIRVKDGIITEIMNHYSIKTDFKKDMKKYRELNKKLKISA